MDEAQNRNERVCASESGFLMLYKAHVSCCSCGAGGEILGLSVALDRQAGGGGLCAC